MPLGGAVEGLEIGREVVVLHQRLDDTSAGDVEGEVLFADHDLPLRELADVAQRQLHARELERAVFVSNFSSGRVVRQSCRAAGDSGGERRVHEGPAGAAVGVDVRR